MCPPGPSTVKFEVSLSETGREGIRFPESHAQMGHEMKSHEACVGMRSLGTPMCGFPQPVPVIQESQGLCSPSKGSRGASGWPGFHPDTLIHLSSLLPADAHSIRLLMVCLRLYGYLSPLPLPHQDLWHLPISMLLVKK